MTCVVIPSLVFLLLLSCCLILTILYKSKTVSSREQDLPMLINVFHRCCAKLLYVFNFNFFGTFLAKLMKSMAIIDGSSLWGTSGVHCSYRVFRISLASSDFVDLRIILSFGKKNDVVVISYLSNVLISYFLNLAYSILRINKTASLFISGLLVLGATFWDFFVCGIVSNSCNVLLSKRDVQNSS